MSNGGRQFLPHDWFSQPLPANITLGERTWLYSSYAFIHYASRADEGLRVGRDTGIYHGTHFDLGPDAEIQIGDYCTIVGAIFATNGKVAIGDYAFIAHDVVIADSDWPLPTHAPCTEPAPAGRPCSCRVRIAENVWIAPQVTVIGSVNIGEGAIVGAGAVVTTDVPAYTLCAGNPLRVVRRLDQGKA